MQEDLKSEQEEGVVSQKYIIHIDNYDGPLEILWELIKKSKIDIAEISISSITEQYIDFLRRMENMNVTIAMEFIWMASELLYYKSKSLLPVAEMDDEFFTPPLPPELINKLLEYKKFQKASSQFNEIYESQSDSYPRENINHDFDDGDEYIDVSLFDLLKAFAVVLESKSTVEYDEIIFDEILVSDRIEFITGLLKEKEYIVFQEIFPHRPGRPEIVATFLAILEMSKTHIVKLLQHRVFGDIRIVRNFSLGNIASEK